MNRRRLKRLSVFIVILLLGFAAGIAIAPRFFPSKPACQTKTSFVNPQLSCTGAYPIAKHGYAALRSSLDDYLAREKKSGTIIDASIYLRDLYNGPVMNINDEVKFAPASLLKVPLLLTYLRLAENNPTLLSEKIGFRGRYNQPQSIIPSVAIKENTPYTIEELLTNITEYSDNQSYAVLLNYLAQLNSKSNEMLTTYQELGIIEPKNTLEATLTVRSYASIFRMLYHATYLSVDMSEKALELLSRSTFRAGIVAGVPETVSVAHKFGERYDSPENPKQLHDCGIVYYSDNPYLLCVMTRGQEMPKLADVIGTVSGMVYKEIDSRKK